MHLHSEIERSKMRERKIQTEINLHIKIRNNFNLCILLIIFSTVKFLVLHKQ